MVKKTERGNEMRDKEWSDENAARGAEWTDDKGKAGGMRQKK